MTLRKFDNRYNPIFRWDCESLLEASGNNLHLTGSGAVFRQVYENVIGLSPPVTVNRNGVHDAILQDYDDLTIHILCMLRTTPSGAYILAFQASGETEATNYDWSIVINQNTVTYFAEYGAGQDTTYPVTVPFRGLPAVGVPFYLGMRRKAVPGGITIQFFLNDAPFGPVSGVLPAPTGGTTDQLVFNQTGSNGVDLIAVEIDNAVLTDAQHLEIYNRTLGEEFGVASPDIQSLWVGAPTTDGATVALMLTHACDNVRLIFTDPDYTSTFTASVSMAHGVCNKFTVTGLDSDTEYLVEVECDGTVLETTGSFRTYLSGPSSFLMAFSGDAFTGSNHVVFDTIREMDPKLFVHMGDTHYHNYTTNDQAQFHAAWNEILAQPRQARLYREVPTIPVWDDHDFGNNNCDASSPTKPAAAAVYRNRVPHYPLPDSVSIYQTWDIGRVRFIITDQRSAASPDSATDNASKSMLGAAQKTWFKNLLSNSLGMLIVWICPRTFDALTTAGADSWAGFTTERREIADHIKANCHGRVVVLSADMHALAIDDGSHYDFATGGGEPLPVFQASPLDIPAPGAWGTYTSGTFINNGQFGTMEVTDTGGSSIGVVWKGWNSAGSLLATHSFSVSV